MEPGISSYTYTWAAGVPGSIPAKPLTVFGLIDKASALGIKIVQIADNMPVEKLSDTELEKLRSYAESKGISPEMGGRGLTTRHTIRCLETADIIGSPLLRMVIDTADYEPDTDSVISLIRDLLPEFKKKNIKLAIENHDRLKAREFERIVLKTDPEIIGICLDSVNSMGAGEGFETVSEILAPYTINLHVKDFTIHRVSHKMGFVIEGSPAGKGMLDIPGLVNLISSYGRCNSAILELWTPPEKSVEETIIKEEMWALESVQFLKTIMQ